MDLASNSWDEDAGTLHNDAWPLQMVFHSYDPIMAITDDTDNIWYASASCVWMNELLTISIWDWKVQVKLNKFSNENVYGSSISSAHFINEMASSLMLTASSTFRSMFRVETTLTV